MKKLNKILLAAGLAILAGLQVNAQMIPTLEMTRNSLPTNFGFGTGTTPMTSTFQNDVTNTSAFVANSPTVAVTVSFQNQQFTGLSYGCAPNTAQTTGLVFGAGPSLASDPICFGATPYNRYNIIGEYGGNGGPTSPMFTSNPTATGAQRGTGIQVQGSNSTTNGAFELFTTAQVLASNATFPTNPTYPIGSRVYFGDVVLTFNQPVLNPVIHVAGLGGSYRYLPLGMIDQPSNYRSTFFTTELELKNTGVTSTLMSGNPFIQLTGNNILNNNHVNPNGGSIVDPFETFDNLGAATGSIRINGVVKQLVYRVYLQGGTGSQFPWSAPQSVIAGATRDPFTGDIWYLSASLDKPTQQVSGSVFIDKDVTDNDIHTSFGLPNDQTNAGGTLHANLIAGGIVIATVPVTVNGDYLFDNVPVGTYTVQVGTTPGIVGTPPPLPANWARTGEFIGAGPGTDGTVNGTSSAFVVGIDGIVTDVDFGIKSGLCAGNILSVFPFGPTDYFGGFEVTPAASNFHPNGGVNLSSGPGRLYARTPLTGTNYSVTNDPSTFDNVLSSFKALSGHKQLVVKPVANQVAYYLVDSAGIHASGPSAGMQSYFLDGPKGAAFKGWFANTSATNAIVKIKIYNADIPTTVYLDENVTVTGAAANSWTYWNKPWEIPLGAALPKKLRFDIISVNGAPFSIDDLCFVEPQLSPLQIDLNSFTVTKSACTANLVWKTTSETNSDRFEIEVATNGSNVYTKTAAIAAAGSSSTEKTYQYAYPMQSGVTYYFRIKMIDKDGAFKNSDIRSASCNGKGGIEIAPNPVITSFIIKGMETGRNVINIFAANGQLVKSQVSNQVQETINISNLAAGLYAVKIMSEKGNVVVEKLIKKQQKVR